MWFVYILKSLKHPFIYVGFTRDIERRLREHNEGLSQSTRYCAPYVLEGYVAVRTKGKALELERYFKKGSGKAFLTKHIIEPLI